LGLKTKAKVVDVTNTLRGKDIAVGVIVAAARALAVKPETDHSSVPTAFEALYVTSPDRTTLVPVLICRALTVETDTTAANVDWVVTDTT